MFSDTHSFHEEVQKSLERRKADVIELAQPMSESMTEIHEAIVNCMNATLNELKRSNTTVRLFSLFCRCTFIECCINSWILTSSTSSLLISVHSTLWYAGSWIPFGTKLGHVRSDLWLISGYCAIYYR